VGGRCAAGRGIGYPAEPGEIRRRFLGQPAKREAKAQGEKSMSVKRLRPESVVGPVPQGPRDTVKAGLPEPQLPDGASTHPSVERLQPDAAPCIDYPSRPMHLRRADDDQCGHLRERTGHLQSRSDVLCHRNAGWPKGRDPYGHGVLVGGRAGEGPAHGEGGQVASARRSVRYARCVMPKPFSAPSRSSTRMCVTGEPCETERLMHGS